MKNVILCLTIFLCCCFSLQAQTYTETVYLKNGSIINGIIVEQIPNESLKIKTKDGNLFVFQMDEVAKITKDVPTYFSRTSDDSGSMGNYNSTLKSGYRGFIDLGYSFGVGDYGVDRIEFSTSHGYQFNPYFYLGAGAGFNYYHDGQVASVPIFANPRVDFPTGSISPFVDVKVGYSVSDHVEGFYFSPSAGVRFALQNKTGLNFSVGYTLQRAEVNYYDYNWNYYGSENVTLGAITLKLGFDF